MNDTTRQRLSAHVTTMRQHLAAAEQAITLGSLPDVLICVADLMDEAAKAGDLAKAEIDED